LIEAAGVYAGPEAVLAYLSRYTHRVAISNSRLISLDDRGVTFRWKDYRAKGRTRLKTMTLDADEFMRRFLLHVLPTGFHRIRHYGLLANGARTASLALARKLLHQGVETVSDQVSDPVAESSALSTTFSCPHCGHPMIVLAIFTRDQAIPQQAVGWLRQALQGPEAVAPPDAKTRFCRHTWHRLLR
jgi:predicted RNA-binding Zn-ribbon protein involved in translation (DUF1610 family)